MDDPSTWSTCYIITNTSRSHPSLHLHHSAVRTWPPAESNWLLPFSQKPKSSMTSAAAAQKNPPPLRLPFLRWSHQDTDSPELVVHRKPDLSVEARQPGEASTDINWCHSEDGRSSEPRGHLWPSSCRALRQSSLSSKSTKTSALPPPEIGLWGMWGHGGKGSVAKMNEGLQRQNRNRGGSWHGYYFASVLYPPVI